MVGQAQPKVPPPGQSEILVIVQGFRELSWSQSLAQHSLEKPA
jgi:hypothetical protein